MYFVACWAHDNVVLPLGCAGEQLRHGVFELGKGLAGAEAALLAVDAGMGQIEVRRPYAGERIKHPQGFGKLLHHVMTFERPQLSFVSEAIGRYRRSQRHASSAWKKTTNRTFAPAVFHGAS